MPSAVLFTLYSCYQLRYGETLSVENVTFILTLAQSILMWGSVVGALLVTLLLKLRYARMCALRVGLNFNYSFAPFSEVAREACLLYTQ